MILFLSFHKFAGLFWLDGTRLFFLIKTVGTIRTTFVSLWANCLIVVLKTQDRAKPAFVDALFTIAYCSTKFGISARSGLVILWDSLLLPDMHCGICRRCDMHFSCTNLETGSGGILLILLRTYCNERFTALR